MNTSLHRRWFPALVCAAALVTAGCGSSPNNALPSTAGYERVGVDGSWSAYYKVLPDLVAHTDVVVVGEFTKRGVSEVVNGTDPADVLSPLKTTYDFRVDRVLRTTKGSTPGDLIAITQAGGIDDARKVIQESDDDPLFSVGEHALLFLNEYAPGKYNVSGGPTGRFKFESGRVSAVVSDGVDIHNMPLDTLASNLR